MVMVLVLLGHPAGQHSAVLGQEVGAASAKPSASERSNGPKAHQPDGLARWTRCCEAPAAGSCAAVRWLRLLLALSQVVNEDDDYGVPAGSVRPR